jgi:voltage-gated potassium channel
VRADVREQLRTIFSWEAHHRRLVARLLAVVLLTLVVDAIGSVVIFFAERHARGTEITTFGDAAFFTTVQLLTVSSQLPNPFTVIGRVVDILLELWAVLVVAGSAGAIAAFFQNADTASPPR